MTDVRKVKFYGRVVEMLLIILINLEKLLYFVLWTRLIKMINLFS